MDLTQLEMQKGSPTPFGNSISDSGVNFSLFSPHAEKVFLCLFTSTSSTPLREIPMSRSGEFWHIHIRGLPQELCYAYKLEGPYSPELGHLFEPRAYVLDPFAKGVVSSSKWGDSHYFSNPPKEGERVFPPRAPLNVKSTFNWENIPSPKIPFEDLIIYEMHVRGFTEHSSANVQSPGTFLGVIEKIPHLKSLGINAAQFMPVFEFDEREHVDPSLVNYWGYSPVNFFTPMRRFGTPDEFKEMVKALHKNGIEVILDVVFNHTSEGNSKDFYLSYRGVDNVVYYLLNEKGEYQNFSGCGNTFKCHHPIARQLILESLRFWKKEMHVDGFRFDLASILTRNDKGEPQEKPPLIEMITHDPDLKDCKLIAEPWDPGGLYQVGSFPSWGRWAEWNGKYRDCVREYLSGKSGNIGEFASRICGSEDLYGSDRRPYHSINFITAHDGFTLRDLVTYEKKHNEANGEENRDGSDYNANWNCGQEGETSNPEVFMIRERQMKNYLVVLFISLGTPMLLMGDEYGHTRKGNNNTWCQDNELNWFLWDELEKKSHFFPFIQKLIHLRKEYPILKSNRFYTEQDISWYGRAANQIEWDQDDHFLAFTLQNQLYIAFNSFHEGVEVTFPDLSQEKWHLLVDTQFVSPDDFQDSPTPLATSYHMAPYSCLILIAGEQK